MLLRYKVQFPDMSCLLMGTTLRRVKNFPHRVVCLEFDHYKTPISFKLSIIPIILFVNGHMMLDVINFNSVALNITNFFITLSSFLFS